MAKSKLLSKVRTEIRRKNFNYRVEQAYIGWIVRFIYYHDLTHPKKLGEKEVVEFLNYLAVDRVVTASIQEQARCAIGFYYKHVLQEPLEELEGLILAKDPNFRSAV